MDRETKKRDVVAVNTSVKRESSSQSEDSPPPLENFPAIADHKIHLPPPPPVATSAPVQLRVVAAKVLQGPPSNKKSANGESNGQVRDLKRERDNGGTIVVREPPPKKGSGRTYTTVEEYLGIGVKPQCNSKVCDADLDAHIFEFHQTEVLHGVVEKDPDILAPPGCPVFDSWLAERERPIFSSGASDPTSVADGQAVTPWYKKRYETKPLHFIRGVPKVTDLGTVTVAGKKVFELDFLSTAFEYAVEAQEYVNPRTREVSYYAKKYHLIRRLPLTFTRMLTLLVGQGRVFQDEFMLVKFLNYSKAGEALWRKDADCNQPDWFKKHVFLPSKIRQALPLGRMDDPEAKSYFYFFEMALLSTVWQRAYLLAMRAVDLGLLYSRLVKKPLSLCCRDTYDIRWKKRKSESEQQVVRALEIISGDSDSNEKDVPQIPLQIPQKPQQTSTTTTTTTSVSPENSLLSGDLSNPPAGARNVKTKEQLETERHETKIAELSLDHLKRIARYIANAQSRNTPEAAACLLGADGGALVNGAFSNMLTENETRWVSIYKEVKEASITEKHQYALRDNLLLQLNIPDDVKRDQILDHILKKLSNLAGRQVVIEDVITRPFELPDGSEVVSTERIAYLGGNYMDDMLIARSLSQLFQLHQIRMDTNPIWKKPRSETFESYASLYPSLRELSNEQQRAFVSCVTKPFVVIDGPGGCGKSTLLRQFIETQSQHEVLVLSFQTCNVAALRNMVTKFSSKRFFMNCHKLLSLVCRTCWRNQPQDAKTIEEYHTKSSSVSICGRMYPLAPDRIVGMPPPSTKMDEATHIFYDHCPLERITTLVVDETSLLDPGLLGPILGAWLACAHNPMRLIMAGDTAQQKSIRHGNLALDMFKFAKQQNCLEELVECHRTKDELIFANNTCVRNMHPENIAWNDDTYMFLQVPYASQNERLAEVITHFGLQPSTCHVVTMTRERRKHLNSHLEDIFLKPLIGDAWRENLFFPGVKFIIRLNDNTGDSDTANNEILVLKAIWDEVVPDLQTPQVAYPSYPARTEIKFLASFQYQEIKTNLILLPPKRRMMRCVSTRTGHQRDIQVAPEIVRQLDKAYATTAYASQGMGCDTVIVFPSASQHENRDTIYTMITRGASRVVVIGESLAKFEESARREPPVRNSNLCNTILRQPFWAKPKAV